MSYDSGMVEFVTLFLGLTFGVHPVQLTVTGDPVRVELRLDAEVVATLDEPPWRAQVDFGSRLTPHELEAVAIGSDGAELGRARQWLNLPRAGAEARLVVVDDPSGRPRAVRLAWESFSGAEPVRVTLSFDGRPLEVGGDLAALGTAGVDVQLPDHDPGALHFVTAEIELADGTMASAEATFGGRHGAEVSTELTAVPVLLSGKGTLPAAASMGDWLTYRGRPLPVVAVETGPAELVVVRDAGAEGLLTELRRDGSRSPMFRRYGPRSRFDSSYMRFAMGLGEGDRVRFLWPSRVPVEHPRFDLALFDSSVPLSAEDGGLYWFLTRLYPRQEGQGQQLADAVAVAGRRAAAGNRRRALVLVLGRRPEDSSLHGAEGVRAYLEDLRVPLLVWSARKVRPGSPAAPWGETRVISSLERLQSAADALENLVGRQRLLWVRGSHLPQDIRRGSGMPEDVDLLR
ncbi:MAG: hypothetical protein AAGN66_16145 [Acidobacteriota bacterium]